MGVDSPSATLNYHIYNGLIKIDDNREPVGDLAESFGMVLARSKLNFTSLAFSSSPL